MNHSDKNKPNGYVRRTRFKVAQVAIFLCFSLTVTGILIGMRLGIPNLITGAITAGITGITTVAVAYIGGDSYRSSYPTEDNDIVIYQENHKKPSNKDGFEEQLDSYKSPI